MWHICEESNAKGKAGAWGRRPRILEDWEGDLQFYANRLCKRYPMQQDQVDHWYNVCKTQFPIYLTHWSKHPHVTNGTPVVQEYTFNVPYELRSGRVVRIRGKWDSIDRVRDGKKSTLWLQENKTKGDIDELKIARQLTFDLQTMMYIVALDNCNQMKGVDQDISGVRYNVIRRPLSGGKGSIRRHEARGSKPAETKEEFYNRLGGIISDDPAHYFMRWEVLIDAQAINRFKNECFNPLLESVCDWWENFPGVYSSVHYRHPFGVRNMLDEGGSSELDEYLATGSMAGLKQIDNLFTELA
jgi:hypothetical protein